MTRRSIQDRRAERSQQRPAPRTPAPAADEEVLRALAASLRDTQAASASGSPRATPPSALRALAGRLGNRQMAQLHRATLSERRAVNRRPTSRSTPRLVASPRSRGQPWMRILSAATIRRPWSPSL